MTDGDIRFSQLNIQQFSPTYDEFSQHCGEELDFNLRNNNKNPFYIRSITKINY